MRRTTITTALCFAAALLGGCTSAGSGSASDLSAPTTLAPTASGPTASTPAPIPSGRPAGMLPCADPDPSTYGPVSPPVPGATLADGGFTATWTLDGGGLTVSPPPVGVRPAVSLARARCTLLAGVGTSNFPVMWSVKSDGFTLGLGVVTVADDVAVSGPFGGATYEGVASPPPASAFRSRLAWVAITAPQLVSSCPNMTAPAPSRTAPTLPPYQVFALDATTGVEGVVYAAKTNSPCFPNTYYGPSVVPLWVMVSTPWQLLRRKAGGMSGMISIFEEPCDVSTNGANTSRTRPGVLEVDIEQPIASCGQPREHDVTVLGPTASDPLPKPLIHAPTGYLDEPPGHLDAPASSGSGPPSAPSPPSPSPHPSP